MNRHHPGGGNAGGLRARGLAFTAAFAAMLWVAACGSRTGVLFEVVEPDASEDAQADANVPDVTVEAGPDVVEEINPQCTPHTCTQEGWNCGVNGDGCGHEIACGVCKEPQFCGGGGFSKCGGGGGLGPDGGPICVPTTCKALGFNCGPAGDGCGGILQCGVCQLPLTCGGGGTPGTCGGGCTGLCLQQVQCDSGTTSVSGRVVTGTLPQFGNPDPVASALVYVPNAPVQPFQPGVACAQCGTDVSGDPLVGVNTAPDGTFTLKNMPVGTDIPLVIQLGRWRRQVVIPRVSACTNTPVSEELTRLPRNRFEGDIPATAIATGEVDSLECVLMKLGVDQAEFTLPGDGGRVHMYDSNGAVMPNGSVAAQVLWDSESTLSTYDQVILPCEGALRTKTTNELQNMVAFANAGGRVFATHWSYSWLYQNPPFSQTANFINENSALGFTQERGFVDESFGAGQTFDAWLIAANVIGQGQSSMLLQNTRGDVSSVNAPSEQFMFGKGDVGERLNHTLLYDFYTPVGQPQGQQCGRVTYSDFHVVNRSPDAGTAVFPTECPPGPMSKQEKALEYMLLNLASCVPSTTGPCVPRTCADQGYDCGPAGDGCGGLLECGVCTAPQTCGGGGVDSKCGYPDAGACVPKTCAQLGYDCGVNGDGCGGMIDCGTCVAPAICGGGGKPSVCGI